MDKKKRLDISASFVLFIFSIVAILMIIVSYITGFSGGYIRVVQEYVFVPMQKGIEVVSNRISLSSQEAATIEQLQEENAKLMSEVERLSSELSNVALRQNELEELRSLLKLKQTYSNYETTGAYVIGGSASNWSDVFIIDKGKNDGLRVNMNVLAGEGLVGIITEVGADYATVKAIIDDSVNVSGTVTESGDNVIISGSLEGMTKSGMINMSGLEDENNIVEVGQTVVTSNISDKYVPGLLIGYISGIQEDASGLTKSGTIVPVVDFKHLNEVLVILTTKQTGDLD